MLNALVVENALYYINDGIANRKNIKSNKGSTRYLSFWNKLGWLKEMLMFYEYTIKII